MHTLLDLWHQLSNVPALIAWGGAAAIIAIVFAETGLLVGFFLPGDSLLVSAGLVASQGVLNVYWLGLAAAAAAVVGDAVGFSIGHAAGPRIFTREDSRWFNRRHLLHAHAFYEKHGGKTIILARFMPVIRTFAPVVAGAADMRYRDFAAYNVVGAIAWVWGMLLIGYGLGHYIPGVGSHIDAVITAVVVISIAPAFIAWIRRRRAPAVPTGTHAP